jgi:hypothetical protein
MIGNAAAKCMNQRIPRYTGDPTAPPFSAAIGPLPSCGWLRALPHGTVATSQDSAAATLSLEPPRTFPRRCGTGG